MDIDLTDMTSLLGAGRSFSAASPARKRARGAGANLDGDEGRASEADGAEASPPLQPMCPVLEAGATAELLTERVRVTASEAAAIEAYEQGSEAWLLSRRGTQTRLKDGSFWSDRELERRAAMGSDAAAASEPPLRFLPGRLTASNFGTAVGHNKYTSADALVEDMLWGVVVSNEAMRYGNETEPVACDIFETALFFLTGGHVRVEHRGLMLACPGLEIGRSALPSDERRYEGWCGTSPDGIVHYSGPFSRPPSLLEIKCPSGNRRLFYSDRAGHDRYGIPHYYFDQIQGIMGLQHLPDALFVVHLPDRTQVARYVFQPAYFEELMRGLRTFWFERYLPAAVACARGRLRRGAIMPDPGASETTGTGPEGMNGLRGEAEGGMNGLRGEAEGGMNGLRGEAEGGMNGLRGEAEGGSPQPAALLLLDDDPEAEARSWLEADARPPAGMDILLREPAAGGGDEQEDGELESE